jgi:hypothetical protein
MAASWVHVTGGHPMSELSAAGRGRAEPDAGERFHALFESANADFPPELLPTRLATTCAVVLPVDGVGLGVVSGGFRVPLGSSDDDAGTAERLQFTVGEGPCLQAISDGREVRASAEDTARLWPTFYDELVRRTPYRSIASVPLHIAPAVHGALDLYFRDDHAAQTMNLAEADRVGDRWPARRQDGSASTIGAGRRTDGARLGPQPECSRSHANVDRHGCPDGLFQDKWA